MNIEKPRSQRFAKIFLWAVLFCLVGILSYGLYMTHPIRNFQISTLLMWLGISVVLAPLSFYLNKVIYEFIFHKKLDEKSSHSASGDWTNGCAGGCGPIGDLSDVAYVFLVIIAVLIVVFICGFVLAILLIPIEMLIELLFKLRSNKAHGILLLKISKAVVVVYAAYMIAYAISFYF